MSDLGRHIEVVARALLGEPNERISVKGKILRFGTNGSWSIDLAKGTAYSHELNEGGGVLWLIEHERKLSGAAAFEFLRELGCDVDERPRANGHGVIEYAPRQKEKLEEEEVYDYLDETGKLLYQAIRYALRSPDGSYFVDEATGKRKKTFRQRRPDGKGGWIWNLAGIRLVPYRLPELIEAAAEERAIVIVEGERKADALAAWGVPATCNPMGSGKWPADFTEFFRNAHVLTLPDNDDAGRKHVDVVGAALNGSVASHRVLDLPGLPPKGDIIEWRDNGGTVEEFYQLVEISARPWPGRAFVSKFGSVVWGEPREERTQYEYLVKGLIPRRDSVLIYGASQSGKSFWTFDLAMTVVRGQPYRGRRTRRGLVVYCAAEAGVGFVDVRMPAYGQRFGVPMTTRLPFVCLTRKFDLFGNEEQLVELIAEIKHHASGFDVPLEVVVIDTLNKTTPGMDEIHGKDVGLVMTRLDRIRHECNCGLWLVHHKNAAGTGPRGHTSLFNAYETAIEINRTSEMVQDGTRSRPVRVAKVVKQREGEDGHEFRFVLAQERLGLDTDGDERTSCVVLPADGGDGAPIAKPIGFKLTEKEEGFFRALMSAIADRGVHPAVVGVPLPASITKVVEAKDVRAAFKSKIFPSEDDTRKHDERVKKDLQRTAAALKRYDVIGVHNSWIWWTGKPVRGARGTIAGDAPPSDSTAAAPEHDTLSDDDIDALAGNMRG